MVLGLGLCLLLGVCYESLLEKQVFLEVRPVCEAREKASISTRRANGTEYLYQLWLQKLVSDGITMVV
ncbi:hypothetical protein Pdw03_3956 [Penicillium digitatum]|uniref:Uncharacterized protein n=1 Tax=Penicillium digitatum TaxID=36651 RepID=A0A7T6XHD1_PENDI|nr:hypothetical protein Pdw03_3956 [Penicillium digitatum]